MNAVTTKKILVVDDNLDLSELMAQLLRSHGYAVSTACDGSVALQQIATARPDVILSDLRMPVMDGIAMRDELRSRPATRDIPIVFITGMLPHDLQIDPQPLRKPVKLDELLAHLSNIIPTDE